MEEMRTSQVGSRRHHVGKVCLFVCSLLASGFLVFPASDHLLLAAESGQPKNVLVLYSFSDRRLFDPLERLKLRQWNMPMSALPHGAVVMYRQPTIWEKT